MATKTFLRDLLLFILLNAILYFVMARYHSVLPFNKSNYINNMHHYKDDPRINGGDFNLLNALGQADAQWYMKIAEEGYPKNPTNIDLRSGQMDGITYAFFPLYPSLIHIVQNVVHDIGSAAFIMTAVFLIISFFLFRYLLSLPEFITVRTRTLWLFFLFPFSIFFRSYFTEGLSLCLLLLIGIGLLTNKYHLTYISAGLLNITRGNIVLLNVYLIYRLWRAYKDQTIQRSHLAIYFLELIIFIAIYTAFNYYMTDNPFYFVWIRKYLYHPPPLLSLVTNFGFILLFPILPIHSYHVSLIDSLIFYLSLLLLMKSKGRIPSPLWWISLCIWLTPAITTDTMSFSRYQSLSFPLFIYIAQVVRNKYLFITLCIFVSTLLFVTSLYFVNWYWVG